MAIGGLSYQAWLIWRRPPARRTTRALAIFGASVAVCAVTALVWGGMWLRYR